MASLNRAGDLDSPLLSFSNGCSGEVVKRPAEEMLPRMLLLLLSSQPLPPLALLAKNSAAHLNSRFHLLQSVSAGSSTDGSGRRSLADQAAVEPLLVLVLVLFAWQVSMADDLACVLEKHFLVVMLLTTVASLY